MIITLRNDLAELPRLAGAVEDFAGAAGLLAREAFELNLVLVGAHGASVLNAVGRVEPVSDARSDWFTRRLSTQAGDTLHG